MLPCGLLHSPYIFLARGLLTFIKCLFLFFFTKWSTSRRSALRFGLYWRMHRMPERCGERRTPLFLAFNCVIKKNLIILELFSFDFFLFPLKILPINFHFTHKYLNKLLVLYRRACLYVCHVEIQARVIISIISTLMTNANPVIGAVQASVRLDLWPGQQVSLSIFFSLHRFLMSPLTNLPPKTLRYRPKVSSKQRSTLFSILQLQTIIIAFPTHSTCTSTFLWCERVSLLFFFCSTSSTLPFFFSKTPTLPFPDLHVA